jgi:hypothetical protein
LGSDLKFNWPTKRKIIYFALIDISVLVTVFALLVSRPLDYTPAKFTGNNRVSPYLTNYLAADFYNGLERNEPFRLIVEQAGINDIVSRLSLSGESEGVVFSSPAVILQRGEVVLMGLADVKGIRFVVTIIIGPKMDEDNRLHLTVNTIKVGALNLTMPAKLIGRRMYDARAAELGYSSDNMGLQVQVVKALLKDEPFEPVIEINEKKVQIDRIDVNDGFLFIDFKPIIEGLE